MTTRTAVLAILVAFLAVIGAYVALTITGHDADGLVTAVTALLAAAGLGVHSEHRTRQQNADLKQISRQTNGVLDSRIHEGATKAMEDVLTRAGVNIQPRT